jgi:hypothetical protein
LALGSWLLALGSWLLALGSWLLALGSWLLALGSWLLALGSWLLGSWLLALGSWLLALGSWLLAVGFEVPIRFCHPERSRTIRLRIVRQVEGRAVLPETNTAFCSDLGLLRARSGNPDTLPYLPAVQVIRWQGEGFSFRNGPSHFASSVAGSGATFGFHVFLGRATSYICSAMRVSSPPLYKSEWLRPARNVILAL